MEKTIHYQWRCREDPGLAAESNVAHAGHDAGEAAGLSAGL